MTTVLQTTSAAIAASLKTAMGGYTDEELRAAFNLVKDKEHWKNDIDAIVDKNQQAILSYAIPFITGGGYMDFIPQDDGKVRVVADGYWSNGMDG